MRASQVLARVLKEHGIVVGDAHIPIAGAELAPLPRLHVKRPRPGHIHAARKADIRRILRFFGEQCTYGLRSIELVHGDSVAAGGGLLLGRLIVPGRIVLYDHPSAPWQLAGRLSDQVRDKLRRAGALVESTGTGAYTIVWWPDTTLRDFMLFDVLMHEIGHHVIQQYTGKDRARVARTKDHEAFADRFAIQCRLAYGNQRSQP